MRLFVGVLMSIAAASVSHAECPRWVGIVIDAASDDSSLTVVAMEDALKLTMPSVKSLVSLVTQGGSIVTSEVINVQIVFDEEERRNGLQRLKFKKSAEISKNDQITHIFYPAFSKYARLKKYFPPLIPKKAKGSQMSGSFDISVDANGDGHVDLVAESFCHKEKCADEYVITEIQSKNGSKWSYCGKFFPL